MGGKLHGMVNCHHDRPPTPSPALLMTPLIIPYALPWDRETSIGSEQLECDERTIDLRCWVVTVLGDEESGRKGEKYSIAEFRSPFFKSAILPPHSELRISRVWRTLLSLWHGVADDAQVLSLPSLTPGPS